MVKSSYTLMFKRIEIFASHVHCTNCWD